MKAQFFIISSIIMVYVITLTFQYLTGFSDIKVNKIEEQQELSYIQRIKSVLVKNFNASNYSNKGDFNKIMDDFRFTDSFLRKGLSARGIKFSSNFIFFSNGFESGNLNGWTDEYLLNGNVYVTTGLPNQGSYSAEFTTLGNPSGFQSAAVGIKRQLSEVYVGGYFRMVSGLPLSDNLDRFSLIYLRSKNPDQAIALAGISHNSATNSDRWHLMTRNGVCQDDMGWAPSVVNPGLQVESDKWYYVELYWKEDATKGTAKMWVDGVLVNEINNVDTSQCGDAYRLRVGINDAWQVQNPLEVYGDCMSFGGNYIEAGCHPDKENYFVFNMRTKDLSTNTEFPFDEYEEEPETPLTPPPTFSCADVLCLKFDEGSGNKAYDSSANHNDGDIYTSGRNQVKNPSFEMDKQNWGSGFGTWDIVTDEKYHGGKSSRLEDLTGDSGDERTGVVYIPVTPGQKLTISVFSKGSNIVAGSESWQKSYLIGRWTDSGYDDIGGYWPDMQIGDGSGTWNWKRTSMTVTAPSNAAYYHFSLGLRENSRGTLWVDAVQVEYGNVLTDFTGSTWTSGKFNYALEFDGVDTYVRVDNIPVNTSPGAYNTVMFWMYWKGIDEQMPIAWQQNYDLYFSANLFGFNTYNSDIWGISSSGLSNRWVHVTAIFYNGDGRNSKLFIDGVEKTLSQMAGITGSKSVTNSFNIGVGSSSNDYFFNGIIDEVRIWSRELTQAEIQDEMNKG